jgi:hypothetical protein
MNPGETVEGHQGPVLQYAWWLILSDPQFVKKYKWKPSCWGIKAGRYPVKPHYHPSRLRFDKDIVILSDLEHKVREDDEVFRFAKEDLERVYKRFVDSLLEAHDANCVQNLDGAKQGSGLWQSYFSTYIVPHNYLSRVDSDEAERHPDRVLAHDLVTSFMRESSLLKGKGTLSVEAGPPTIMEYASREESLASARENPGSAAGSSVKSHQTALSRVASCLERLYALIPPAQQKAIDPSVVVGIAASIIGAEYESLEGPGDDQSRRPTSVTPNPESTEDHQSGRSAGVTANPETAGATRVRPFWKALVPIDESSDSDPEDSDGSSGSATPAQKSTDAAARKRRLSALADDLPWTFIRRSDQGQAGTVPETHKTITSMDEFP